MPESDSRFLQDMVVLKKRARPLKLRMIDGTTKTVMVDDSITMVEIVGTSMHPSHGGVWELTRSELLRAMT